MSRNDDTKLDMNRKEFSEARRKLLKLAAYVPPAIMGAALFDIPFAAASSGGSGKKHKSSGKHGGKKKKKESCAPHVCKPHRSTCKPQRYCKPRRHHGGGHGGGKSS